MALLVDCFENLLVIASSNNAFSKLSLLTLKSTLHWVGSSRLYPSHNDLSSLCNSHMAFNKSCQKEKTEEPLRVCKTVGVCFFQSSHALHHFAVPEDRQ